jgi:hypothetical protein
VNQEIAEIAQHPFTLLITLDTVRQLTKLLLHPQPNLIADRLRLTDI